MKYILILIFALTLCSCFKGSSLEERFEVCPYEHKYGSGAHYIVAPINMTPHKQFYKVGDTLTVSMDFSDSIYDLAKDVYFHIEDFPFKPVSHFFRVEKDIWDDGFRVNDYIFDEKYQPIYGTTSLSADNIRSATIYEDGRYTLEYKIILEAPGNYLMLIRDAYNDYIGVGNASKNDETDAITFEGKCEGAEFFICTIVDGNPHFEDYYDEIAFLDTTVFFDNLGRIDNIADDIFGKTVTPIDWNGGYCFTVEE